MANNVIDISSTLQKALNYHKNGDIDNAISNYESVTFYVFSLENPLSVLTESTLVSIISNLGALYISTGQYDLAKTNFEKLATILPNNSQVHYNFAVLLTSKYNEHSSALRYAIKAIKYDPSNHKILHLIGNIFQSMNRLEDAEKYFIMAENLALNKLSDQPTNVNKTITSIIPSTNTSIESSTSIEIEGRTYTSKCISTKPLIFYLPNFLSVDECENIKLMANNKNLEKSFVMGGGSSLSNDCSDNNILHEKSVDCKNNDIYRSSFNTWLPINHNLSYLHDRVSALTGIPLTYLKQKSEELQVVKYENGGEFKVHHDSSSFHSRLFTVLVYLQSTVSNNELEINGGTWFPYVNSREHEKHHTIDSAIHESLDIYHKTHSISSLPGLVIQPVIGSAILFYNYDTSTTGTLDLSAVHAGLPIVGDEKWIANLWVELNISTLLSSYDSI